MTGWKQCKKEDKINTIWKTQVERNTEDKRKDKTVSYDIKKNVKKDENLGQSQK